MNARTETSRSRWAARKTILAAGLALGPLLLPACASSQRWLRDWEDLGRAFEKTGRDITGEGRASVDRASEGP